MKSNTGQDMAGIPAPVPGSAEGTEDQDKQSQVPPAAHTPGSAEGEDYDDSSEAQESSDASTS